MDNQPNNAGHGRPGALDGDLMDHTGKIADARGISGLSKNNGKKERDEATYVDETSIENHKEKAETLEEDFEPFNLDSIDE